MSGDAQFQRAKDAILGSLQGTQSEIAEQVGVSQSLVQRWRSGQRTPSLDHLSRLAEIAGMELVIEARDKRKQRRKQ